MAEVIGVIVNFVFVFTLMYVFFKLLDKVIPLRVSEEIELEGLDESQVSVTAYPDFSMTKTQR
jgi:Amt family ammonium transporter